jgi:hypothetical protein
VVGGGGNEELVFSGDSISDWDNEKIEMVAQ